LGGTSDDAELPLPPAEVDALLTSALQAQRLAAEGDVDSGRILLVAGLERAEEIRKLGRPWAEQLAEKFRLVLDDFDAVWKESPAPAPTRAERSREQRERPRADGTARPSRRAPGLQR
jgi:hypothetical protein